MECAMSVRDTVTFRSPRERMTVRVEQWTTPAEQNIQQIISMRGKNRRARPPKIPCLRRLNRSGSGPSDASSPDFSVGQVGLEDDWKSLFVETFRMAIGSCVIAASPSLLNRPWALAIHKNKSANEHTRMQTTRLLGVKP